MKLFAQQTLNEKIAYGLLAVITIVLSAMMVYFGDWTIGDDAIYLRTTALGNFNWCLDGFVPESGRLFPLAHFDYNLTLLMPFLPVVKAHYLLNAFSFCIYVFCLWILIKSIVYSFPNQDTCTHPSWNLILFIFLVALIFSKKLFLLAILLSALMYFGTRFINDNQYKPWVVVLAIISLLLQPMWSSDFFELHTGTRFTVVLTACFILFIHSYLTTHKISDAILALLIALYITFKGEFYFGVIFVFASTILLFYPNKTKQELTIFYSLLGISLSYVVVYCILILPNITHLHGHYNEDQSYLSGIFDLLGWVKLYSVAFVIAIYRCFRVLFKKDRDAIFMDACLASGMAGMIALISLKLFDPYNHMINIVFCYIPVVYWVYRWVGPRGSLILYILLTCGLIKPYINTTSSRIHTMQISMPAMEKIYSLKQSGYDIVICTPSNSSMMKGGLTEQYWYDLFMDRFTAFLQYVDINHNEVKIIEKSLENISASNNRQVIVYSNSWVDDDSLKYEISKNRQHINIEKIDILY